MKKIIYSIFTAVVSIIMIACNDKTNYISNINDGDEIIINDTSVLSLTPEYIHQMEYQELDDEDSTFYQKH